MTRQIPSFPKKKSKFTTLRTGCGLPSGRCGITLIKVVKKTTRTLAAGCETWVLAMNLAAGLRKHAAGVSKCPSFFTQHMDDMRRATFSSGEQRCVSACPSVETKAKTNLRTFWQRPRRRAHLGMPGLPRRRLLPPALPQMPPRLLRQPAQPHSLPSARPSQP